LVLKKSMDARKEIYPSGKIKREWLRSGMAEAKPAVAFGVLKKEGGNPL
jgi:hypothetical protein